MGYDLHITRRAEWADPESGPPITREEFERVVLADARFRRDEGLGPQYAVLDKNPRDGGDAPWLCWQDGEITTKNPPRSFIKLAAVIAATLNARVVGDDGEEYGPDGRAGGADDDRHERDDSQKNGPATELVESDANMRRRLHRERAMLILQWSGIVVFLAIFVALLGRQVAWW